MKITIDAQSNTICFQLGPARVAARTTRVPAVIDIGASGRLMGIELDVVANPTRVVDEPAAVIDAATGTLYILLEEGSTYHARSATVTVDLAIDAAGNLAELVVPRRGEGYEITYPSGNR